MCSLVGQINTVKMARLPKEIYQFNTISIIISMTFSTELKQITLKFTQNHKFCQIAKAVFFLKAALYGLQERDSPTRDHTCAPCPGSTES